jgi:protein-L-isoaspartate(D-aspartate) O-methyltransferase
MAASSAALRRRLVLRLERKGCIVSEPVRDAFLAVPRELFLPEHQAELGLEAVYRDEAILTRRGARGEPLSSSSQPAMMALMLERLGLFPGARVLEIGAGTGYNAALLATIVGPEGRVTSVELDTATADEAGEALARGGYQVRVVVGDGHDGFGPGAPYDRIVVTASAERVERSWYEQLVPAGLLQAPLWIRGPELQLVTTLLREDAGLYSLSTLTGAFMPLRGPGAELATARRGTREDEPPMLRGPALERMPETVRERLLALTESPPRLRRLEGDGWSLWFFLRVMTPARLLVFSGHVVGVAGRDGHSLALLARGGAALEAGRRPLLAVSSYGGGEAEARLLELVERWRSRGRPGDGDLSIRVRFDGERSRLRCRWPRL